MRSLLRFLRDEDGQDLTEYSLGVAFVALLSAAIFVTAGSGTSGIWGQASNTFAGANTSVSGAPSDTTPPDSPPADPGNGDGDDHHHHGGDGGG